MTIANITQKTLVLSLITSFTLTGCGIWATSEAPVSSESNRAAVAQPLEQDKRLADNEEAATVLTEAEGLEAPAPPLVEKPDLALDTIGEAKAGLFCAGRDGIRRHGGFANQQPCP